MLPAALVTLVLCAEPAAAEPGSPPPPGTPHELSFQARAAGRGTLDEDSAGDLRLRGRLAAAQLEVRYEYQKWLRAQVEVELGPVPPPSGLPWMPAMRDVYVRLGRPRLAVRAGHFKPPTSAVELEASWDMPLVRRGFVHDVMELSGVAGRRFGLQGELKLKKPLDLSFRAGAFHLLPGAQAGTALSLSSLAGRAELDLGPLAVGTFAQAGLSSGGSVAVSGGADAVGEWRADGPWAARAWADVVAGNYPGFPATLYVAGRAIAAVRAGGLEARAPYAELFATAEGVTADQTPGVNGAPRAGGGGGVTAGWWDLARLTFQAEGRSDGEWAVHGQVGVSLDVAFAF